MNRYRKEYLKRGKALGWLDDPYYAYHNYVEKKRDVTTALLGGEVCPDHRYTWEHYRKVRAQMEIALHSLNTSRWNKFRRNAHDRLVMWRNMPNAPLP